MFRLSGGIGHQLFSFEMKSGKNLLFKSYIQLHAEYTGKNKDPDTWVFSFRTFNLNHSWILSQLSYERALYIKSFV